MRTKIVLLITLASLVACVGISDEIQLDLTTQDHQMNQEVVSDSLTTTDMQDSMQTPKNMEFLKPNETTVGTENHSFVPPEPITIIRDVQYGDSTNGEMNLLDLYLPVKSNKKVPAIVWIHGGGLNAGDKSMARRGITLVKEGFALVGINYRLAPDFFLPEQIYDAKAAIRWVRANADKYNIDPGNIGVLGGSAGALLAAVLGTSGDVEELEGRVGKHLSHSSRVQAVVALAGVYDLSNFYKQKVNICRTEDIEDQNMCYLKWFLGCSLVNESCWEALELGSAISHVSADDPPFYICIGNEDQTPWGIEDHTNFNDALQDAGVDSTLVIVPEAKHGECYDRVYNEIVDFFGSQLIY